MHRYICKQLKVESIQWRGGNNTHANLPLTRTNTCHLFSSFQCLKSSPSPLFLPFLLRGTSASLAVTQHGWSVFQQLFCRPHLTITSRFFTFGGVVCPRRPCCPSLLWWAGT